MGPVYIAPTWDYDGYGISWLTWPAYNFISGTGTYYQVKLIQVEGFSFNLRSWYKFLDVFILPSMNNFNVSVGVGPLHGGAPHLLKFAEVRQHPEPGAGSLTLRGASSASTVFTDRTWQGAAQEVLDDGNHQDPGLDVRLESKACQVLW